MMADPNTRPIDLVVNKLAAAGCNPKGGPSKYTAKCPNTAAHSRGDKNPSLSVGEGVDGKALVHCHTGCTLPDIARALDVGMRELFPDNAPMARIDGGKRVKATYAYYDTEGTLVFEVVRYEPKGFRQRQPNGSGGWIWNLNGIDKLPLYHAPQVAAAIAAGKPVWIVEGEKDAEALQWEVDGATTTNSGGAGSWKPEHTAALAGANEVHIVRDADEKGLQHARTVAKALTAPGRRIVVHQPAQGHKDVAEHLGAGRTADDLELVWDSDVTDADTSDLDDEDNDWSRIDLVTLAAAIREGTHEPIVPTELDVEGATPLFYRRRINSLFGESGGGKTWVALAAVRDVTAKGSRVAFIDYEDAAAGIAERLVLLGCSDAQIALIDYRNPSTGLGLGIEHLSGEMASGQYDLVVIDSTGEAMASGSVNPNADEEVAMWFRKVKEITRFGGGPAVVVLDHIPKDRDAPSSYAIGSQRKRAAVTGAAYRVDTIKEPAKGRDGKLKLTVAKDRPGNRARGTIAAIVDVETSDGGSVALRFHISEAQAAADAGRVFRPTVYMERISRWLEINPGKSKRDVRNEIGGRGSVVDQALDLLVEEGFVRVQDGPRNSRLHTSIRPFREETDVVPPVSNPVDNDTDVPPCPTVSHRVPSVSGTHSQRPCPTVSLAVLGQDTGHGRPGHGQQVDRVPPDTLPVHDGWNDV